MFTSWIGRAYRGRMGRKNFIPLAICIMVLQYIMSLLLLNPLSHLPLIGIPMAIAVNIVFAMCVVHVYVRRLHDLGLSGWALLLTFIPVAGWMLSVVMLLLLMVLPGKNFRNSYGEPEQKQSIYNAFFAV